MIFNYLHKYFFATLRGRLILGVALVHAVMMSLFVVDLLSRQRKLLQEQRDHEAAVIAETLAISAAEWLAAYDAAGLQELIEAQRTNPDLIFALLTDRDGRILAHTDKSKTGQFLLDLPQQHEQTIIGNNAYSIDIAVPAKLAHQFVGWCRIGLSQKSTDKKIAAITINGIIYALVAILIGSFIAWRMGYRLTRRLYTIQEAIALIRQGDRTARCPEIGTDEAAQLAQEFNVMLNSLEQSDAALNASEKHLRELFEESPIGLVLRRMNGSLISANPAFLRIIGYPLDEALKLSVQNLTPQKYMDEEQRQIDRLKTTGRYGPYEKDYIHKSGHLVPVRLNGMVVVRDGEELIWSSVEDITALKEAEMQKNELEEHLRQSQKMEAIGTLAGGIAHDFNNLLAAIQGYTELTLRTGTCDEKTEKNLEHVLTAAERAKELVKKILTFSRKEKRRREPLDIHTVVEEALTFLIETIPSTVHIQADLDPATGLVWGDATEINQVVINLCTNAYHALPAEGGRIDVTLKPVSIDARGASKVSHLHSGQYAQLTVADNGTGMPPEIMARIFEPFYTTKKPGQGTGMGLAVIHGIVQSHDGAIDVASEDGKGSIFTIIFPLSRITIENEPGGVSMELLHGTEHILWIDDEKNLTELGKKTFESLGYRVTTSCSSLVAYELFRNNPDQYDLIITDQTMPDMTGDQLARNVLQIRPDLPIIICTGHSEVLNAEKAKEIGVKALIMKPWLIDELNSEIRKIFD